MAIIAEHFCAREGEGQMLSVSRELLYECLNVTVAAKVCDCECVWSANGCIND